jgi:hypothetical protein
MYAVTWRENDGLFATRLATDGRSLDGRGVKIGDSIDERVIFDGSQFVVPFLDNSRGIEGTLVARFLAPENGIVPGELPIAAQVLPGNFAVAAGRDGAIVVWSSNGRVWAASIDRATRMLVAPPLAVSPSTMRAVFPFVAWNGAEYLVTFTESTLAFWHGWFEQPKAIRAARLSGDLLVRDPDPLTISTGTALYSSVASNSQDWLIASDGHLRRLLRDGSLSAASPFVLFGDVVWDGANYVAMWRASTGLNVAYIPAQGPIVLSQPVILESAMQWCPCPAGPTLRPTPAFTSAGPRTIAFAYTRIADDERYAGVKRASMRVLANPPPRRRAVR